MKGTDKNVAVISSTGLVNGCHIIRECNSPLVAHCYLDDISYLQESIRAVKAENSEAAIVVNMHDISEWLMQPNEP